MKKTAIPRGQEQFVFVGRKSKGCLWNGIYQFEGTIFWKAKSVVLGSEEWEKVKESDLFEMVKGSNLLRSISGDDARKQGTMISTPNGQRFAIPLTAWTEFEHSR